jgi:hypothetical protein
MEQFRRRTATIIVAMGEKTTSYGSFEEVPASVRTKIATMTSQGNCKRLLIADENGREEILRSMRKADTSLLGQLTPVPKAESRPGGGRALRTWIELGVLGAMAAAMWALFRY